MQFRKVCENGLSSCQELDLFDMSGSRKVEIDEPFSDFFMKIISGNIEKKKRKRKTVTWITYCKSLTLSQTIPSFHDPKE